MENYILILLTILIVLVITIVYFGYRQLTHIRVNVNKNTSNIAALQSYLSKLNNTPTSTSHMSRSTRNLNDNYQHSADLSSGDNIDVSDSSDVSSDDVQDQINNTPHSSGKFSSSSSGSSDSSDQETDMEVPNIIEGVVEVVDIVKNVVENVVENVGENVGEEVVENVVEEVENLVENVVEVVDTVKEKKMIDNSAEQSGTLNEIDGFMNAIDNMLDNDTKMIQLGEVVKKQAKSTPKALAKDFEIGHIEISEKSGESYEVVANKNGSKRWKKIN
jgi:hypothetical protein